MITTILFLVLRAHAGHEVGNGGDVVICTTGAKPQILDYVEAQDEGTKLDFPSGTDAQSLAQSMAKRLSNFAPGIAGQYERRLGQIMQEIDFRPKAEFRNIKDSLHVSLPKGCKLQQAAIHRFDKLPGQKEFLINKDLWDSMDVQAQAGLLLHEVIYEHLIHMGESNSIKARALNAMLASDQASKMSNIEFKNWALKAQIPLYQ